MKSFLRSIWPLTVPAQVDQNDLIAVLRERILQAFLLTSLVIASVVLILVFPTYLQIQRWVLLGLYCFFFVLMSFMTTIRRIPYNVRSVTLLAVIYMIGLGSCIAYGLSGNGPVLLAAFVSITAIFLGIRSSIGAGLIALMTMVVIGFMMSQNLVAPPPASVQSNSSILSEWVTRALVVSLVGTFFIITLAILINGLQKSLFSQKNLTADLVEERDSLESRVEQRTRELERRAVELETTSAISRDISQISSLELLLPTAVELIKKSYNLYYAGLFLLDERHEFAVLRAGTGEAGVTLLSINHQLKLAETSMVGYAILKKEVRLAQDIDLDPIHFRNPYLPDTRSELCLPLIVNGEAIGALNIQSEKPRFFTPDDIRIMQIAADQLAVAIEKAQLLQQLTKTLDELRQSFRQTTQQSWQGFMRVKRQNYSYQYRKGNLESTETTSTQAYDAMSLGHPVVTHGPSIEPDKGTTTIAVPIRLREHVLGVLNLTFDTPKVSPDLYEMLEAVANRMALALENARLLEEIQMRAAREHLVGDISTKVRAESEIDKVLQTVAGELGRSLGVSGVLVQLRGTER